METIGKEAWETWRQFVEFIATVFSVLWNATIGQISTLIARLPDIQSLPYWKQALVLVVLIALAILVWFIIIDFLTMVARIIGAVLSFLQAIVHHIVYVLVAGLVAFGGAWAINNLTIPWMP